VHFTAEYCAPVWCRSAHTHLIDPAINDALRIVTGCYTRGQPSNPRRYPTPWALLHGVTLSLACCAMEPGHFLHSALTRPLCADARHLKSRHPFVPAAQQLISSCNNTNMRVTHWADHQWSAEWADNPTRLHIFILDTGTHPGATLPRRAWV